MSRYLSREGTVVLQDFKDHSAAFTNKQPMHESYSKPCLFSHITRAVAVSILGGGTRETDTGVFSDVKFRKLTEE